MTYSKLNTKSTAKHILCVLLLTLFYLSPLAGQAQTVEDSVEDAHLENTLRASAEKFMQEGKTIATEILRGQLKRTNCKSRLPALSAKPLSAPQVYKTCQNSVVIIGALYKCDKCEHWHVAISTAFTIAAPDVFVTNYHVFRNTNEVVFVAMNRRQNVQPIQEILAASEKDDIAIIRIPGMGLRPLALRTDAQVGETVSLISHADHHFYFFSQGTVGRFSNQKRKDASTMRMEITADFCRGSSGGPILDDRGNAIGMVASTRTVLYDKDRPDTVQMVFKECVPATSILKLIRNR